MSELMLYNSYSRQKEAFTPLRPGTINLYVCGMTVYDFCHLGHARMLVAFDVISRFLRASGYDLNYTRNITDIDDKIIQRANANQESITDLTTRFITAMHEDERALNILPPDHEPRATDYMPQMIALIEQLLAKDVAYIAESGDVNYRVNAFADYGQLAKRDLDGMRAGARVAISADKADPLDFVLWKMAKPGEPSWSSPWGHGRPGWHIECSAMSMAHLGEQFDIHGGGMDLLFPHHENEIAQSEAATCKKFVNYWLHNGFVQVDDEKMSKSLGNFLTIRDVLKQHQPEVLRYFLLASHYRSQISYSDDALHQSKRALTRLYLALRDVSFTKTPVQNHYTDQFFAAMNDDFNTPQAVSVLFELAHALQKQKEGVADTATVTDLANTLGYLGDSLGLLMSTPDEFLQAGDTTMSKDAIDALIAKREQARRDKDWALSDKIRDDLCSMGIVLEDSATGTTWRQQ